MSLQQLQWSLDSQMAHPKHDRTKLMSTYMTMTMVLVSKLFASYEIKPHNNNTTNEDRFMRTFHANDFVNVDDDRGMIVVMSNLLITTL